MTHPRRLAAFACALLCGVGSAHADEMAWDPLGPVPNPGGFTAAAADPDIDTRFWIADSSTVWVTTDGGRGFTPVFRMARGAGSSRGSQALEDDEDIVRDLDGFDPLDFDDTRDPWFEADRAARLDEDLDLAEATGLSDLIDASRLDEDGIAFETFDDAGSDEALVEDGDGPLGETSEDRLAAFSRTRFGVSRLRVIGDDVWICSSRGLWRVPRAASTLGAATEIRIGRRVAVNDVLKVKDDVLFVGTDAGLWRIDGAVAERSRGVEYDTVVFALVAHAGTVFAATSLGLQRGDEARGVFVRSAAGGRADGGLVDLVRLHDGRLLAVDGNRAYAYDGDGRSVVASWQVPGASRLASHPRGGLVAVGPRGPWRFDDRYGWNRMDISLPDRRLRDAIVGAPREADGGTPSALRVVGRGGAWRLVAEGVTPTAGQRLERAIGGALARRPALVALISRADEARALTLARIDAYAHRERLAWLLPTLRSRLVIGRQRDERLPFIPSLGVRTLDLVEVRPVDDHFEIMAFWDLMPAVQAALEASSSRIYEASRIIARDSQRRVRETLPPLYWSWNHAARRLWREPPRDTRAAISATLTVAHLEAQLHAASGGAFPVTTDPRELLFPPEPRP